MPSALTSEQIALLPADLQQAYLAQRSAYFAQPIADYAQRMSDLQRLADFLNENKDALVEAISADFGHRSSFETLSLEIFVLLNCVKDAKSKLRKWMRVQKRHGDFGLFPGARNRVIPQPLGVVGVIVPWNYPLFLSFGPLISMFAAGNRALVKMSENSSQLAQFLIRTSEKYFAHDKLCFFADENGNGPAFSQLPFDHLLFTGSGHVGKLVMASAAKNLTPVTLELGGKVPAIIDPEYSLRRAAERIMWVKLLNAGQICASVDYVFLPKTSIDEFIRIAQELVAQRYPNLNGDDYTSIPTERFYQRLEHLLLDAKQKGARIIPLAPNQVCDRASRRFPPYIVLDVRPDMLLMQEEIFGPILPVMTYEEQQQVVDYVNAGDRPLALYPFSDSRKKQQFYIDHVMSGGVSVNDTLQHLGQHDLPFGGVGASGMGHYHGYDGFLTFSKMRPIFQQGPISSIQLFFLPPYAGRARKVLDLLFKWCT